MTDNRSHDLVFPRKGERGAERLAQIIRHCQFSYANEEELQEGIAALLTGHGVTVEREVRITPLDRIDMLVEYGPLGHLARVGIEVKVAGREASVRRQLERYARSDRVDALLLVTNRVRHVRLAGDANGKPLFVVAVINP